MEREPIDACAIPSSCGGGGSSCGPSEAMAGGPRVLEALFLPGNTGIGSNAGSPTRWIRVGPVKEIGQNLHLWIKVQANGALSGSE